MNRTPLALLVTAFALAGCATLSQPDREQLIEHRVSNAAYQRMIYRQPLELADIIELSKKGLPPQFIIRYLDYTSPPYPLTSHDVSQLHHAGVNSRVIDYLLDNSFHYQRDYYHDDFYPYGPYYGYSPYWYDFGIGFGGGHYRHWR